MLSVFTECKSPGECIEEVNYKPDDNHVEQAPPGSPSISNNLIDAEPPHEINKDGKPASEKDTMCFVLQLEYRDMNIAAGVLLEIDKKLIEILH